MQAKDADGIAASRPESPPASRAVTRDQLHRQGHPGPVRHERRTASPAPWPAIREDAVRKDYNTMRPHQSLNMAFPAAGSPPQLATGSACGYPPS
jgi:hypothetical protein